MQKENLSLPIKFTVNSPFDKLLVIRGNTRNWGKMAVEGYCLARVDTSAATAGQQLYPNGLTLGTSFGTIDLSGATAGSVSNDIGVLLADTAADGLMPVWLR